MNVKIIRAIDRLIGAPLCFLFSFVKKKRINNNPKKILFIQLWGIGETILTLPAIEAVRKKYPGANLNILCTPRNKAVYTDNAKIDGLLILKMSLWSYLKLIGAYFRRYDIVIDFEEYLNISTLTAFLLGRFTVGFDNGTRSSLYDLKTAYNDRQHVVETHLDLVRLLGADWKSTSLSKLRYSEHVKIRVERLLKKLGITKKDFIVGFGAGVAESAKSRMWPQERFGKLALEISKKFRRTKLIFLGTDAEKRLNDCIISSIKNRLPAYNLAGKTNLKEAFAVIERCSLVVANDTGIMHIAAAQGVKTIGLFGPNIPLRWAPYGHKNLYLYKGKACKYSPCINVHKGEVPECRLQENVCMKAITVQDIVGKL